MLRITVTRDDGIARVLKLEGKLLADWVGELTDACRVTPTAPGRLELDLGELSFVDETGTNALRDMARQGVRIIAVSPFVGERLKEL
jgi:hypothetical protein